MTEIYKSEDVHLTINGTKLELPPETYVTIEHNCQCGKPSEYGCHGVKNGEVYDEFLCKECYNK